MLDSLAVYTLQPDLPDSTLAVLRRYEEMIRGANIQFRSGAMRITTAYESHGTYVHSIHTDAGGLLSEEPGTWYFDPANRTITCVRQPSGHCTHHGARITEVTECAMVLEQALRGAAAGLGETFWLSAIP